MPASTTAAFDATAFDWSAWTPQERAVLCFIVDGARVLLIHKRRGLGAGKINAPGGKIEPGETAEEAAIRETQEEIGVTPRELSQRGALRFQFVDGYALECEIFRAERWEGEPTETAEALPFWQEIASIPYAQMWEDDQHWLPHMLRGNKIAGSFIFDEDRMLTKHLLLSPDHDAG